MFSFVKNSNLSILNCMLVGKLTRVPPSPLITCKYLECLRIFFLCQGFMFVGKGKYNKPTNMVVNNNSNLIKIVIISIIEHKTSCDTHKPIDNVFVANVCQVGHIG